MNKEQLINELKEERAEDFDQLFNKSLLDIQLVYSLVLEIRYINKIIKKLKEE